MNRKARTARGIANRGFSGMRRFVTHFNYCNDGYDRTPQSLTDHTANRSYPTQEKNLIKTNLKQIKEDKRKPLDKV